MTSLDTSLSASLIFPDWEVPSRIKSCVTTRQCGVSEVPFDSLNLATHVGDNAKHVLKNREMLQHILNMPSCPRWLEQVHGTQVADDHSEAGCVADAGYSKIPGQVCVVLTADCLPVFFASADGREVAVAHAGWKGLLNGVLEATLEHFEAAMHEIVCWLGPAIGPQQFEVGPEVREAFLDKAGHNKAGHNREQVDAAFKAVANDKYLADIYQLATIRLRQAGVVSVSGGGYCTVTDGERFYSYRRDGQTGRMASLIWIEN